MIIEYIIYVNMGLGAELYKYGIAKTANGGLSWSVSNSEKLLCAWRVVGTLHGLKGTVTEPQKIVSGVFYLL